MINFAVTKNKINMKTLPKFFAIKRDANNPLWMDYISWWNRTYDKSFSGDSNAYYGFDGKADYWYDLISFDELVEVITLEQWNECVNGVPVEMKKTIKEWLQELPAGYRERALKNLECDSPNEIVDTMAAAIDTAFSWHHSKEGAGFWWDVHNHYTKGETLPELPKDETGKLIGYKLTGKVSPEQAGAFFKCDANVFPDGTFFKVAHEGVIRRAKEAGVLDIWFEPVYAKPEIIHSVGGKFDVTIKEGKIYHNGSNITEYVKEVKEFADSLPNKIKGFDFEIKDIILRQTGCERKETSIKDWVELYGVWSKNQ